MEQNETKILYDRDNKPFALKATGGEAKYIVALLNADSNGILPWIKLKDSTPNDKQQCLTLSFDGNLEVASYDAWHNCFSKYNGRTTIWDIVYWMNIPTPPDISRNDL